MQLPPLPAAVCPWGRGGGTSPCPKRHGTVDPRATEGNSGGELRSLAAWFRREVDLSAAPGGRPAPVFGAHWPERGSIRHSTTDPPEVGRTRKVRAGRRAFG